MLLASGDWTAPNVIQSLVAAGTLVMAIVTGAAVRAANRTAKATVNLVNETKDLATATARSVDLAARELELVEAQLQIGTKQVDLAQRTMQATYRPLLANVPLVQSLTDPSREDRGAVSHYRIEGQAVIRIVFPIRNIGVGAAIIKEALLEAGGSPQARCEQSGLVVAAGEQTAFSFVVPHLIAPEGTWAEQRFAGAELRLTIDYADAAGDQLLRTELHASHGDWGYRVRRITLAEVQSGGSVRTLASSDV